MNPQADFVSYNVASAPADEQDEWSIFSCGENTWAIASTASPREEISPGFSVQKPKINAEEGG